MLLCDVIYNFKQMRDLHQIFSGLFKTGSMSEQGAQW